MKFVADESVDQPIVHQLRHDGHDVWAVIEQEPGIPDIFVLEHANQRDCILLTADKDFGDLVFRDRRYTFGVILIRLTGLSPTAKAAIVSAAITTHANEIFDNFTVITSTNIRIRPRFL